MAITTVYNELIAANAISGTLIADNAITSVHIATNAVSGLIVADNSITTVHIAENNVTSTSIVANAITSTQLADNAVIANKIPDGIIATVHLTDVNVTTGKIANDAITLAKMAGITRGSIIIGNSGGDPAALAIGSNDYVLTSDGTDIAWEAAGGGAVSAINNATANELVTIGSTTTELDAETKLTFDGSTLKSLNLGTSSLTRLLTFTSAGSIRRFHLDGTETGGNEVIVNFVKDINGTETSLLYLKDGNIGLGTGAIDTWHSSYDAIQGANFSLVNDSTAGASKAVTLAYNAYIDSGNAWTYINADEASHIQQYNGKITFATAAAGSADADITFSTKMTILNNGNVGIGIASGGITPTSLLHLNTSSAASYPLLIEGDIDNNGGYTGIQFGYNGGNYTKAAIHVEGTSGVVLPEMHFLLNSTGDGTNTQGLADARLSIINNGNVGIGTTSPGHKFSVRTPSAGGGRIHLGYNGTSANTEAGRISSNSYDVDNSSYSLAEMSFMTSSANGYTGGIQFRTNSANSTNTRAAVRMTISDAGHITPGADDTQDLGSSSLQWRNIYTGDLHLNNLSKAESHEGTDGETVVGHGNDVDNTNGSWTIQEGANDLFLINKLNNKKYKFDLTEIT